MNDVHSDLRSRLCHCSIVYAPSIWSAPKEEGRGPFYDELGVFGEAR